MIDLGQFESLSCLVAGAIAALSDGRSVDGAASTRHRPHPGQRARRAELELAWVGGSPNSPSMKHATFSPTVRAAWFRAGRALPTLGAGADVGKPARRVSLSLSCERDGDSALARPHSERALFCVSRKA